jgi:hypothetical protein
LKHTAWPLGIHSKERPDIHAYMMAR